MDASITLSLYASTYCAIAVEVPRQQVVYHPDEAEKEGEGLQRGPHNTNSQAHTGTGVHVSVR
jgi:hypothetical protein